MKTRGRPPKNAESAQRLAAMKRPKYLYSGTGHSPVAGSSSASQPSFAATSASIKKLKSTATPSSSRKDSRSRKPWDDDDEEEDEKYDEQDLDDRIYDEDELMDDEDDDETMYSELNDETEQEDEELADDESGEHSDETLRRRKCPPVDDDDEDSSSVPPLALPPSSTDLICYSSEHLMRSLSIYEILRHFSLIVRLQVFRFEDFLVALHLNESNSLLSQIHIQLLKALIREDDNNQTTQGPQDVKDSINGSLYFIDHLTWPQVLRTYLSGDEKGRKVLQRTFNICEDFPLNASLDTKLLLLEYLCDCFLQTTPVRELITSTSLEKGTLRHDDHCRMCHKLGDLLCCEGCEAVYHLQCLDPPLTQVPSSDWICDVCKSMTVEGVSDCYSNSIVSMSCVGGRQEPIGWDRHKRKYWFMARRIFVEDNHHSPDSQQVYYYSIEEQFEQLFNRLSDEYEKELKESLQDLKEEIERQMKITKKITKDAYNKAKLKTAKIWFQDEQQQLQFQLKNGEDEQFDDKQTGDGDPQEGKDANENKPNETGILTRLKTGTIQQKQINLDPFKSAIQAKENENDYILVEDEEKACVEKVMKKNLTEKQKKMKFKLGLEGSVFSYKNKFTSNHLALNKHQHQEERDKKRFMSHKFSLTTASEFKWRDSSPFESRTDYIQMLRATILHLESLLCAPFLHPNWSLHRNNWIKAVNMCASARDFLLAIMILESSLKPCLFNAVWHESLGHLHLHRLTFSEREEMKKNEKKEKREFMEEQEASYLFSLTRGGGGVKYTLGKVKHQIWKQRGEEYRLTGKGGFYWFSALFTRKPKNPLKRTVRVDIDEEQPVDDVIDVSEDLKVKNNDQKQRKFYKSFAEGEVKVLDTLLDRRLLMYKIMKEEEQKRNVETKCCYSPLCSSSSAAVGGATESSASLSCYSAECRARNEKESTRSKVNLARIVRINGVLQIGRRIGKRSLGKGQLPPCPRFTTNKTQRKSIFVLPRYDLRKLARNAALREVAGFSYTAKLNPSYWRFGNTPRPLFRTTWLWRCVTFKSLPGVALQLRLLWACLRWDDLTTKPPPSGNNVVTNENEVITTELLKRRDLPPFGIRSEYLIRRIIVPIDVSNVDAASNSPNAYSASNSFSFSQRDQQQQTKKLERRSGLRERKRKNYEENGCKGPSVHELWVNEDELELWEMKLFGEKLEK
ncbi:nucleosome-remodeling factor subunit BPTF-like protein, partial [Dinothrombium tinctorium]